MLPQFAYSHVINYTIRVHIIFTNCRFFLETSGFVTEIHNGISFLFRAFNPKHLIKHYIM